MKVKIKVEKEFDIKILKVKAKVRNWADSYVDGKPDTHTGRNMPCSDGKNWSPEIDVEKGKIINWEQSKTASIIYKVGDGCSWELIDENGLVVLSAKNSEVPKTLCPKKIWYGDYIKMNIDENGIIEDFIFKINYFQHED